jgi:coenzyme Q-binding protein COQ10
MKIYGWSLFSSTPMSRQEKAYIGFSKEQLYQVVSDVANYKTFLPWCTNSIVHSTTLGVLNGKPVLHMEATLEIGFPPFYKEQYTSQVTMVSNEYIQARLHQKSKNQLLSDLRCDWRFEPNNEKSRSTKVTFDLKFAFSSATHQSVANMVFHRIADMMGNAFIKRCEKVYGPPSHTKKVLECVTKV